MAKYISNRLQNLKIGIVSYTENKTVLEVTGNVGIKTANTQDYELYVNGDTNVSGDVTAQNYYGSGANLTGISTFVNTNITNGIFSNIYVSGISTLGITSATNLTAQQLNVSGIITASQLSTGVSGTGININTDTISGPATLTIDPAAVGDNTGAVRIKGDLYVDGTQFIVNSTIIELADLNVGIATTVGTNAFLDGAGIGIGSIGIRKTIQWQNSSSSLKSSENFNLNVGKTYKIDETDVLSNTTLGSGVTNSSLTSVGTLKQLNISGVSTLGTVTISSGIISATVGVVTYYGDGSNLQGVNAFNVINQDINSTPVFPTFASNIGVSSVGISTTKLVFVPASGNLGLGTTNPTSKLHVVGDGLFTGVVTATTFYGNISATGGSGFINATNINVGVGTITSLFGTNLNYSGVSTVAGVQISSGIITAVGLGTVVYYGDGSNLQGVNAFNVINQDINSTPVFPTFASNIGVSSVGISTTKLVFIPASGNLGLGTTNPQAKLDVVGNIKVSGVSTLGTVTISSGIISATVGVVTYYGDGSNLQGVNAFNVINQDINSTPVFPTFASNIGVSSVGISTTKLVFIPASGRLGIGTTNPQKSLHIAGVGTQSGGIRLGDLDFFAFGIGGNSGSPTFRNSQTNGSTTLRVLPNGTGNAQFEFFGTDYFQNTNAWDNVRIVSSATEFRIDSSYAPAGIAKPIRIETNVSGGGGVFNNPYQLYLDTNGNIGIGTSVTFAKFNVQGNTYVSGSVGIGTTNPQYSLDSVGDINSSTTVRAKGIDILEEAMRLAIALS